MLFLKFIKIFLNIILFVYTHFIFTFYFILNHLLCYLMILNKKPKVYHIFSYINDINCKA